MFSPGHRDCLQEVCRPDRLRLTISFGGDLARGAAFRAQWRPAIAAETRPDRDHLGLILKRPPVAPPWLQQLVVLARSS
jgi:hypothetical protein